MKRRLHECLRDLDIDDFDFAPEDSLEPLPAEYYNAQAREQKRLRVQKIAQDYLNRGQVPVMLSTRLKGPFTGPWANPWQPREAGAQKAGKGGNTGSSERAGERSGDRSRRKHEDDGWTARAECSARNRDGVVKVAVLEREETENAALEYGESTPTKKQPKVRDREVKRRDTAQEASEGNTRWRGSKEGKKAVKPNCNVSWRSRSDDNGEPIEYEDANDPIQASTPSQTLRNQDSLLDQSPNGCLHGPVVNNNFQSSYSAPMMISSPSAAPHRPRSGIEVAPEEPDNDTFVTAEQSLNPPDSIIQTTPKLPVPSLARRVSSLDVQRMAERCGDATSAAQTSCRKRKPKKTNTPGSRDDRTVEMHTEEHFPPVAPLSFSGSFTYRKVGKGKGAKSVKKKTPPKRIDFGSSPVVQKQTGIDDHIRLPTREKDNDEVPGDGQEVTAEDVTGVPEPVQTAADNGLLNAHEDSIEEAHDGDGHRKTMSIEAEITANDAENDTIIAAQTEDEERRESTSSRLSMYSTQTAFRLAQMGLVEDSIRSPFEGLPPIGHDTPGARTQFPNGEHRTTTPRYMFPEPGPAITPFHAFNSNLDSPNTIELSTQDLFAAASPFAPSTIKKVKTKVPIRRSSLRFPVPSHEDSRDKLPSYEDSYTLPRSPSTDRRPFKDRNSYETYNRSPYDVATSQKCMRMSQTMAFSSPFRQPFAQKEISSVPKLSFPGSIDGDLNFADQFLRNLEEMS